MSPVRDKYCVPECTGRNHDNHWDINAMTMHAESIFRHKSYLRGRDERSTVSYGFS